MNYMENGGIPEKPYKLGDGWGRNLEDFLTGDGNPPTWSPPLGHTKKGLESLANEIAKSEAKRAQEDGFEAKIDWTVEPEDIHALEYQQVATIRIVSTEGADLREFRVMAHRKQFKPPGSTVPRPYIGLQIRHA